MHVIIYTCTYFRNAEAYMPYYRYVNQGEFHITQDRDTTLVTEGMTECIAFALVAKTNPSCRLLCHLDGETLESVATAKSNIKKLVDQFQTKTECKEFEIHIFGGQEGFDNCNHLFAALKELSLTHTKFQSSKDFCREQNKKLRFPINPTNAQLTMICEVDSKPIFTTFSSKLFLPHMSLSDLEHGKGLPPDEAEKYLRFVKANENILKHYPIAGQTVRQVSDTDLLEKVSLPPKSPLAKLSLLNAVPVQESKNKDEPDFNHAFDYL